MSAARRGWRSYVAAGAIAIVAIAAWCVWVVVSVRSLRDDVERNVGTLVALGKIRAALPALPSADDVAALPGHGELRGAVERGDPAAAARAIEAMTAAVRAENRALSIRLGERWRYLYGVAAVVIALALGLLAVLVVSHRRRLRAEAGEAMLAARDATLRDAARRWVDGDLAASVGPRGAVLDDFEQALDDVRRALVARIDEVDARGREVSRLNDDLRLQVKQKSEQLATLLARTPTRTTLAPGALVGGRFEVIQPLGEGGMGAVYDVRRIADGRRLALKLLRDDGNETHRARFVREARLLAEVDHPNVVRILDVDVTDGGSLYFVTELVAGGNLADDARLETVDAGAVLRGVSAGLAAIHAHGVVHRDIKLSNIMVGTTDAGETTVKIVDFGIARDAAAVAPVQDITAHGVMLGTLRYMAPECRLEATPGPPADVFAFGVVAFRLLLGAFPWPTPGIVMIRAMGHLPAPRVPPAATPPPPETMAIVLACLAEDPAKRPTAAALVTAFG